MGAHIVQQASGVTVRSGTVSASYTAQNPSQVGTYTVLVLTWTSNTNGDDVEWISFPQFDRGVEPPNCINFYNPSGGLQDPGFATFRPPDNSQGFSASSPLQANNGSLHMRVGVIPSSYFWYGGSVTRQLRVWFKSTSTIYAATLYMGEVSGILPHSGTATMAVRSGNSTTATASTPANPGGVAPYGVFYFMAYTYGIVVPVPTPNPYYVAATEPIGSPSTGGNLTSVGSGNWNVATGVPGIVEKGIVAVETSGLFDGRAWQFADAEQFVAISMAVLDPGQLPVFQFYGFDNVGGG